ncbi:MAG TPA: membrane dipeptidase [Sphingomicrobium sp.]|nr:membrane dipeptidase [Sphingomicrobium sp.]
MTAAPLWYDRAIVIDGLGGIVDPYSPNGRTRLSNRAWSELRRTGATAVNQTLLPVGNGPDAWPGILKYIDLFDAVVSANPDRLRIVRTAADIESAKAAGQIGLIYRTQDTAMIGTALDRVSELKRRGVKVIQLTYNLRNLSGDGALEPENAGLSRLGHATIARIERENLLLDLAHGGARTIAEGIAAATRPLTISHTGARAVYDHPRNVSDEAIRAVAEKGGVTGVYFMPYLAASSKPTGADLIRHIEHIASVGGDDHVAIGTDGPLLPIVINDEARKQARQAFEQRDAAGYTAPGDGPDVINVVEDYNRLDRFQRLAGDLSRRGWTTAGLEKLFGSNLLRLYRDVWDN